MSTELFFEQLAIARRLLTERLASIRRGERVQGHEAELTMFVDDLERAEVEVRSSKFDLPSDQRSLASARRVLDTWPFGDPLGDAIMELESTYTSL